MKLRWLLLCAVLGLWTLRVDGQDSRVDVTESVTQAEADSAVGAVVDPIDAEVIARIVEIGRNDNRVMDHLDQICNRIGPRLTGSDDLTYACQWACDLFNEMGLEARLEPWGEFPVGFDRGPSIGRMVSPEMVTLEFGTNAWTAGTRGRVLARARLAPAADEDWEALADSVTGAWILIERPQRGEGSRDELRARLAAYQESLDRLMEMNPAGIIQPTRDNLIVTSGNYRIDWDQLPTVPVISLRNDQWQAIAERLADGQDVELEFDIRNFFRKGPIPLYNVVADLPGTEFPDQYVIVGGHLDSWDAATGATDNGAGCATTIEVARILTEAKVRPRRTIRFMLWTGEEQGLLGSRAYVAEHPEVVENTSAVLVHDGGTNYVSGIRCTSDMIADMERVFAPVIDLDERAPFAIEEVDYLRGGGSDHAPFIQAGVPGFFWNQSGRAVYRQTHHTQFDTYDTVVPEYQQHSSIVISVGAYGLASLDGLLSRESFDRDE